MSVTGQNLAKSESNLKPQYCNEIDIIFPWCDRSDRQCLEFKASLESTKQYFNPRTLNVTASEPIATTWALFF